MEARRAGGYCSIPVRREKSAQVDGEAVGLERNRWMLDIFFKVKPVGFFDRVDVVYEKRRIKEKCNIFVLDNCKHDSFFLWYTVIIILFYLFFILFYFYLWWILSYIEMKQPWVYMCSPSRSPLPPPSPPDPSGSSQCTRSERLSHACNLGW